MRAERSHPEHARQLPSIHERRPSRRGEPLSRALTYPFASWHLSNPPRTSSLPFDPQPSCPIVHSWRRSKAGTPHGPIPARRALRSSASSSKSLAHRHSCLYPAGPIGPFGRHRYRELWDVLQDRAARASCRAACSGSVSSRRTSLSYRLVANTRTFTIQAYGNPV